MTCIVGLEHNGDVYVGADSAAVSGWKVRQTRLPKVFRNGSFLIGYTTSFRMGQILQHHLKVRPQKQGEDNASYMVHVFVEAVRECLRDKGFSKVENNREEGGLFLVGYNGTLYDVGNDFQVNSNADGLAAIGGGGDYALGALRVLEHLPPEQRLRQALEAADYFSGDVCGPFTVIKL